METNGTSIPDSPLPPSQQSFILLGPSGQDNLTLPLGALNEIWNEAAAQAINYGSQIGASFIMLVVLLAMTPKKRFTRATTIVHTLALTLNFIRMVLLSVFSTSTWLEVYTVMSGDLQFVTQKDYNNSVAATALSIPVTMLVEAALILQAWSMLQLWPRVWKIVAIVLSLALVLTTVGFNFAVTILQCRYIIHGDPTVFQLWIRQTYLGLITASISWFCFLFISRLVLHMWTTRSILPSLSGLTAMDVLVITNGFLMLVPVIFTGLQFGDFINFESGSLTLTSVVIVLPLGTLVAQRLASPAWFNGSSTGGSATASTAQASSKRRLLSGTPTSPGQQSTFRSSTWNRNGLTSHISSPSHEKGRAVHADHLEAELARIDDEDLERGVRVDHCIEHSVEKVPSNDTPKNS